MEAKVAWKGGLSFDGTAGSGFSLALGGLVDEDGTRDGFSPMELILLGLAGCTAMDVISILEKKRQDVTAFEVKVEGIRCEPHPRVFTNIMVEYVVTGRGLDRAAVKRAVELSETKYCSVQGMLRKSVLIESRITIVEAEPTV